MAINYEDERLTEVKEEKAAKVSESDRIYDDMIDAVDGHYNAQISATKTWEEEQTRLQNQQTDLTVEKIQQEKQQTEKDYTKEQSAAYADWQKQSNPYGVNAERMAANGMTGTGYSESSQVSMYNTYQNRVAVARAAYDSAVQSFTMAMKEAQLQNSAALAEIYLTSFQKQLELSLQGFQHKNSLILEKADKKAQIESTYHERYQDLLEQIEKENLIGGGTVSSSTEERMRESFASDFLKPDFTKNSTTGGGLDTIPGTGRTTDATLQSIDALGYGQITASKLDSLVASGEVEEYVSNGVTLFRRAGAGIKDSGLYTKLQKAASLMPFPTLKK